MNRRNHWKIKGLVQGAFACLLCLPLFGASAFAARGRPHLDTSLGFNMLLSDNDTLLRGVSLSWDGGDPYGTQIKRVPTQASLDALAEVYGLNSVHVYLEGDAAQNPDPVGVNLADCDSSLLVFLQFPQLHFQQIVHYAYQHGTLNNPAIILRNSSYLFSLYSLSVCGTQHIGFSRGVLQDETSFCRVRK